MGSVLRVCAHEYATVNVACMQTLDDSWIALDDTGLFLDEGARVNVQHTVLGAGASATGLAGDLLGDTAKVTIDTDYLAPASRCATLTMSCATAVARPSARSTPTAC